MKSLVVVAAALIALAAPAHATFIRGDVADTKIFFNNDIDATGHNFTGNVDVNNTGPLVNFVGHDQVDPKNGFATIKPDTIDGNGPFVSLLITPTETTWSAFTFRGQLNTVGFFGEIDLAVTNQFGITQFFAFTGLAGPDTDVGDIGITSIDGQRIKSILLTTTAGESFKELKQFEVQRKDTPPGCIDPTGCVITPVTSTPEPMSLAILGVGLVGMLGYRTVSGKFTLNGLAKS